MARLISVDKLEEEKHPAWLVKAGIRDFHEWVLRGDGKLVMVYAVIPPGGTTATPVKHDTEEAAFVISGEVVYVVDGKEIKVPPNCAIFINPGEEHLVRNEGKETAYRISIHARK